MAVRYQTEDCKFRFTGRRKNSDWIRRVAAAEGYRTGDITVVFCSDAAKFGATFENELQRVIIHGILHLLGHGDKAPGEEAKMHALEDKYLAIRETDETKD